MNRLKIIEVYNDHPTEDDRRRYEEGLRILARIIARAILRERLSREIKTAVPCAPARASADHKGKRAERRVPGRHQKPPSFLGNIVVKRESSPKTTGVV